MSVILRDPSATTLGTNWDKNRMEVESAPQHIGIAAKAVCGFVHREREGIVLDPSKLLENAVKAEFMQQVNYRKSVLENAIRQKLYRGLSAAKTEDLQKHLEKLDTLKWPNDRSFKVDIAFKDQIQLATGSGFQISPGYVMTADHVLFQQNVKWYDLQACFNLRRQTIAIFKKSIVYDSINKIERVVLSTAHEPIDEEASISSRFEEIEGHDIAIIEILKDVKSEFPPQTLNLGQQPPSASQTPVCLLGHPHGLPLKYTASSSGQPTRPHIIAPTIASNDLDKFPYIAADIDLFEGNSGGPLLENLDAGPGASRVGNVLGVAVQVASLNSGDMPPITPFWKSAQDWLIEGLVKAGDTEVAARQAVEKGLKPSFGFFYLNAKNTVNWTQAFPTDATLKDKVHFNRVDVFAPFTMAPTAFLTPASRSMKIELDLTVSGISLQNSMELTPKITASTKRFNLMKRDHIGHGPSSNRPASFRWTRTLQSVDDVEVTGLDMPSDLFKFDSGFCPWDMLEVETPANISRSKIGKTQVEGILKVEFGLVVSGLRQTIQFQNRLKFNEVVNSEWIAWIGERHSRISKTDPYGTTWWGPSITRSDL